MCSSRSVSNPFAAVERELTMLAAMRKLPKENNKARSVKTKLGWV